MKNHSKGLFLLVLLASSFFHRFIVSSFLGFGFVIILCFDDGMMTK